MGVIHVAVSLATQLAFYTLNACSSTLFTLTIVVWFERRRNSKGGLSHLKNHWTKYSHVCTCCHVLLVLSHDFTIILFFFRKFEKRTKNDGVVCNSTATWRDRELTLTSHYEPHHTEWRCSVISIRCYKLMTLRGWVFTLTGPTVILWLYTYKEVNEPCPCRLQCAVY